MFKIKAIKFILPAIISAIALPALAEETIVEATPKTARSVRAPSPAILDPSRQGFFSVAVGPAYGVNLETDALMYNFQGAYNFNINERVSLKGLADLYFGSGSVSSRLMNFGIGADVYLPEINPSKSGIPYVSGEAMIGNGRNAREETATGLALGAAAGYKFQVSETNLDVAVHYSLLTATVGSNNPSVLGARVGVHF